MFFESPFQGYPACLIFAHVICKLVVDNTVDGKDNLDKKTREVADIRMYHFGLNFLQLGCDMLWWGCTAVWTRNEMCRDFFKKTV